jgi:hypothetical protein
LQLKRRTLGGCISLHRERRVAPVVFTHSGRSALPLILAGVLSCASGADPDAEAGLLRTTERERLRALVTADLTVARRLHADDFQLITPRGDSVSKEEYLGMIGSGQIDYLVWEPDSLIRVRVHGKAAVIRYQSQLQISVRGDTIPLQRYWHTDSYEKRNGHWQVVWSHATLIP